MKVETIDDRLRANARSELKEKINKAANDFAKAIEILGTTDVIAISGFEDKDNRGNSKLEIHAYNRELIKSISEQAIEKLSVKYEERAISEFMKKVDSLQGQIDELYDISN